MKLSSTSNGYCELGWKIWWRDIKERGAGEAGGYRNESVEEQIADYDDEGRYCDRGYDGKVSSGELRGKE